MNDTKDPNMSAGEVIHACDIAVARVLGGTICQPRLSFTNLSVVHRTHDNGGGVLLLVTSVDQEIRFVLDEPAREALVRQLSAPGEPINFQATRA